MLSKYHREITRRALASQLSTRALNIVVHANLRQDNLLFQFNHDHFHFDSNRFAESNAYIESQRALIRPALENNNSPRAWRALGRLTHAAQDFYAHSDYIPRWLALFNGKTPPPAPEVDALSINLIQSPDLRSGKLYYPLELLAYIRPLRKFILHYLPGDSHAHMNMDTPLNSPHFDYAFHAAIQRTENEFQKTIGLLPQNLRPAFRDSTHLND